MKPQDTPAWNRTGQRQSIIDSHFRQVWQRYG